METNQPSNPAATATPAEAVSLTALQVNLSDRLRELDQGQFGEKTAGALIADIKRCKAVLDEVLSRDLRTPKYLILEGEGIQAYSINGDPLPGDYDFADVGIRSIIRLNDLKLRGRSPEWQTIHPGQVETVTLEGEPQMPAHFKPSCFVI